MCSSGSEWEGPDRLYCLGEWFSMTQGIQIRNPGKREEYRGVGRQRARKGGRGRALRRVKNSTAKLSENMMYRQTLLYTFMAKQSYPSHRERAKLCHC